MKSFSFIEPAPAPSVGSRRRSIGLVISFVLWMAVICVATVQMIRYTNSPGNGGAPVATWPGKSQLALDGARPTLLLFAHPRCPCTRASLGELEVLLAKAPGRLRVHVLFLKPEGLPVEWVNTDLWRKAAAIPGVSVHCDNAGVEARRFHAETSGLALLYDRNGRLQFQGGITLARGHAGDNPGRSAVLGLLREPRFNPVLAPVFGCSLFEAELKPEEALCDQ